MLYGTPTTGFGHLGRSRVLVVVGGRDIRRARNTLLSLAAKVKGARLAPWQRRRIAAMAPTVAKRRKRGLRPTLTQEQAMAVWQIAAGG